ncbi:MAG: rRNA maturation RNase YbeY [Pseudonocardiales bacterium]|nr:rRNA maturation RNase YbeY [Pseudonocardiales bacterium]MBV9030539.1 rRNA maturation RNase YbeY [Pseudonocardiales bacterium]MBW0010147.1 rRNA maturation RNase YbeY [Pseudonocardiales bacterium]
MGIEIRNESGAAIPEASIAAAARFAMDRLGVSPLAELSVLLVSSAAMADLHQRWMDLPGPTDVMAFPMDDVDEGGLLAGGKPDSPSGDPALLGDIVLCPEVAREQAATAGHSALDELHLLTVHGVLHLLGYDHAEAAEEREMFALQERVLDEFRRVDRASRRRIAQRDADTQLLGVVGLDGPGESGPPG